MKRLVMIALVGLLSFGVASVSFAEEGMGGVQAGSQDGGKHHKKKHHKKKKKSKKPEGQAGEMK